ncbi:hypothetical protein HELRODRAFT_173535 [Helobdella robusta]|uniref:Uncharacterized protein n=1 Tax=Helobdella robusta TaxID=6412 RepID=T1F6Y5_HELRO|nr:hypothetical protein HELRODRAFT_173535 [Helobdella robusta]ESO03256.1 hypothetical protein HELRODRAFT_173535 [Helobdella robusta]
MAYKLVYLIQSSLAAKRCDEKGDADKNDQCLTPSFNENVLCNKKTLNTISIFKNLDHKTNINNSCITSESLNNELFQTVQKILLKFKSSLTEGMYSTTTTKPQQQDNIETICLLPSVSLFTTTTTSSFSSTPSTATTTSTKFNRNVHAMTKYNHLYKSSNKNSSILKLIPIFPKSTTTTTDAETTAIHRHHIKNINNRFFFTGPKTTMTSKTTSSSLMEETGNNERTYQSSCTISNFNRFSFLYKNLHSNVNYKHVSSSNTSNNHINSVTNHCQCNNKLINLNHNNTSSNNSTGINNNIIKNTNNKDEFDWIATWHVDGTKISCRDEFKYKKFTSKHATFNANDKCDHSNNNNNNNNNNNDKIKEKNIKTPCKGKSVADDINNNNRYNNDKVVRAQRCIDNENDDGDNDDDANDSSDDALIIVDDNDENDGIVEDDDDDEVIDDDEGDSGDKNRDNFNRNVDGVEAYNNGSGDTDSDDTCSGDKLFIGEDRTNNLPKTIEEVDIKKSKHLPSNHIESLVVKNKRKRKRKQLLLDDEFC